MAEEEKLRLGGMALRNGLLVHGPTHWAAAVRTKNGELKRASGPKPHFGFDGVPGVRGVARLAEAMAVIPLVKRGLPEAKLPMQDAKTLGAMVAAAAGGQLLRKAGTRTLGREALLATVSLAPALLSLRSGDIAAYHGVEHKSIAAYEQDGEPADALKEHDRCGSNLVAPMLASTVVGNVAVRRAGLTGPRADALVGLTSIAFAVEVFAWSERHSDSAIASLLRKPGHEIQRVVGTREPTAEQLEVGRAALEEILKVEAANADRITMTLYLAIDSYDIQGWAPIVLMVILIGIFAMTLKFMPRTKPQKIKPDSDSSVKWDDVAGCDEAKDELREVVEFLRNPKRFKKLGARVPAGILLHGPPGTGKTLLAKAVAHEANAKFFAQSASSFVEMFAGLGAARIRRLFKIARDQAPAIIFIDELDAVGATRGNQFSGEKDQTLNQLLVEMDGFEGADNLVVIAASNLLEKLDPALLRPGRFDRQVLVTPPDLNGRIEILKVHSRGKPCHEVDFELIARQTAGLTGADLANICNEAAIFAGRQERDVILMEDFSDALERVVAGMQSRRVINDHEKSVVAYHEAGHALCSELLPSVEKVHKISIIPRGRALGYTLNLPEEDRYLKSKDELIDYMVVLLGGRVAEHVVFGAITTGASDDLRKVYEISRSMVADYGMGTQLNNRRLPSDDFSMSDNTRRIMDDEQQELTDLAYRRALEMIMANRPLLDELARTLLDNEVLERGDIEAICGMKEPLSHPRIAALERHDPPAD